MADVLHVTGKTPAWGVGRGASFSSCFRCQDRRPDRLRQSRLRRPERRIWSRLRHPALKKRVTPGKIVRKLSSERGPRQRSPDAKNGAPPDLALLDTEAPPSTWPPSGRRLR
ncbi:MAG: hypothetical protein BJ554DRAFT_7235 [Olpidium bornovanus]|uniref:Uncharacterized protein n=1 Tax=Olpidium bornovanus TaxID=278681 RepID=A0A8H7ZWH1_9FUNG|nr:MAG: hypothetical protein BJ554DRAFT_7235 [Olpidium bornovanus]